MSNTELLEQLNQQTDINNVLLLTLSGLQHEIIMAQQSATPYDKNEVLNKMWNRINKALIERDEILGITGKPELEITDLNQDKEAA